MGKRSQTTRKQLSILLILCMVATLPIVSAPAFAAEDNGVKVIHVPSMLWGGLGQYVEYEMGGIKYRTDEASSANNRLAWSRMTQEQRRQTYDRLHTTAARKAAFGEDGFVDIVGWIRETNEWFVANRLWKDRIANRYFPELYQVYNKDASLSTLYPDYDQLAFYVVPENVVHHLAREKFDKALADVKQTYDIGRQYYQKMVDMRGKNIGAVASFTMMQCTQMLSDMLFIPSVVQGATAATSGMIADVTTVLLQVVNSDGGSIAEKVESAMAGHSVQLSLAEQIKLREAVIETYKRLAERCKNELGPKMSDLRFEQQQLQELSEQIARYAQQLAAEREQAKEDYQTQLESIFVSRPPKQLEEGDGIYITLAFKWKTESELRRDLFNNDFETWRDGKKTEADDSGYLAAAQAIFDEVLAQKAVLDQEVMGKVSQISEQLMEAYNKVNNELKALEEEADRLEHKAETDLPEDEFDLTRIPVGETYFYGAEVFTPELENFAYSGRPYDDYYGELQTHISAYQAKVEALLEAVNELKDGHEGFNSTIATDVENVAYYLDLLEKLRENYQAMYEAAIWQIHNDPKVDISKNYDNCPQIDPYNDATGATYRIDGYLKAINEVDLPEAVYDPDVSATAVVDALAVTRPTEVFDRAYNLHAYLDEIKGTLTAALSDSQVNDAAFKAGRTNYYTQMDAWLAAYEEAEQKMAAALAQIKNITDAYEASWQGTYFLGSYNTSNMYPYLYNTSLVYLSAFDVTGLRDYIRGGGNTATLHNKLIAIARKAEENEVLVADLIGRIGTLDLEMQQLWQNTLVDYSVGKGTPIKNFYTLREDYELAGKWGNLTRNSDDFLAYFNVCDIPQVCDILKGETDDVVFLQNAIKEIRGYLDASSVATVPVSNRLYDIYKKATGIKDLYMGSAYTNYGLMTEAQRTDLLNLYANPADADDIYNTMSSVKDKHAGVDYTYPPSQHEGVDQFSPVGEPVPNAGAAGTVALQARIYHPLATQATSITATLSRCDDGWSIVQTLSGTDSLAGMIDPQADMLTMPFTGLEDGREYRIEWNIVHAPYGTALNETGSYYFTYTAPVGVFATVELNQETYDSAVVTVINNSGSELGNQYVFLEGYDENEGLVLSETRPLGDLDTGATTTVDFTFDRVVYTAEVYVAEEDGQKPPVPVRLEVNGGDSTVLVPKSGEAANTTLPFTATVYDQYGEIYEGGVIEWSILPQPEGISIGGDGIVTVTSAAETAIADSGSITCTVTATLSGSDISSTNNITVMGDTTSVDVAVDWSAVNSTITNTNYTYGDTNATAGTLGEGMVTVGDLPLDGTFSYKHPDGILNAGPQVIIAIFTVTTPGEYAGLQVEHEVPVMVARRALTGSLTIEGTAAVGEILTAVFSTEVKLEEYDIIWQSGGKTVAIAVNYTVVAADRGKAITVKAVGKNNHTGEIIGETGIYIEPATSGPSDPGSVDPGSNDDGNPVPPEQGTVTDPPELDDKAIYQMEASSLSPLIEAVKAKNETTVVLALKDNLPESAESEGVVVQLPSDAVNLLAGLDLEVETSFGNLCLPSELIETLRKAGDGIVFSIQPNNVAAVQEHISPDHRLLSDPVEITAGLKGAMRVTLECNQPLPADPKEREAFLASLYVLAVHSQEDIERIKDLSVHIDETTDTLLGFSFSVNRFSTFVLLAENKSPEEPERKLYTTIEGLSYVINGEDRSFDKVTSYRMNDSTTVMAVRLLQELGAKIVYKRMDGIGVVTVTYGNTRAVLREKSDLMQVTDSSGEREVTLRAAFTNRDGRTYLPTRDVMETLGFFIHWSAADDSITISNP